jgi:hypothetical protein
MLFNFKNKHSICKSLDFSLDKMKWSIDSCICRTLQTSTYVHISQFVSLFRVSKKVKVKLFLSTPTRMHIGMWSGGTVPFVLENGTM